MRARDPFLGIVRVAGRAAADPVGALRAAGRVVTDPGSVLRAAESAVGQAGHRLLPKITEHVDLTPVVEQVVDLDSLVATVDVDAIIDRLDLVTLVQAVIAEIDLPGIIRESTGSVASSTVRGVRMQSISADVAVARAVDRIRRRKVHPVVPEKAPGQAAVTAADGDPAIVAPTAHETP
jgi:hypothetical protein